MNKFRSITASIGFAFLLIFFIAPLLLSLQEVNLNSLKEVITNKYYIKVMSFTFRQAFTSAILSVVIGFPGAYLISKYDFKYKKLIEEIYLIPYILPSILVVIGFVSVYGNSGYLSKILNTKLNILYSYKAVLLAHVFYNFPVAINVISSFWSNLDNSLEEQAKVLQTNNFKTFFRITLSRLLPSILSAFTLIFLMCFTSFAIILVLGGGPKFSTIEVEIYRQARISLNTENAATLSLFSLLVSSLFLSIHSYLERKTKTQVIQKKKKTITKLNLISKLYIILSVIFVILPVLGLIFRGLSKNAFQTIIRYSPSIFNTLVIAIFSSILSTVIALCLCQYLIKKKHLIIFDIFSMLPMATSSVLIGLSYFIISRYLSFIPDLILIVLCHSIICMPFCLKTILPSYKSLDSVYTENAMILGSSDLKTFTKIEIPSLKSSILSSLVFSFALSCGELNATLLTSSNITTIPMEIYHMVSSYNYVASCSLGCVLVVICLISNLIKLKILDV